MNGSHHASSSVPRWNKSWLLPVEAVAIALGIALTAAYSPGQMSVDSVEQLAQARNGAVGDWHSPFLTYFWGWLLQLYLGPETMLWAQQSCYWSGAALLAGTLARLNRYGAAWAVIAVSLFPPFLLFNSYILKDTAHYSAMFLASALSYRAFSTVSRHAWIWILGAAIVLIASNFIRINGAFAVVPFLLFILLSPERLKPIRLGIFIVFFSALLIVGVRFINASITNTKPSDVEQSIQLFDLAGIHFFSRDPEVWGSFQVTTSNIDTCYTSFYWDVFGKNAICGFLRSRMGAGADGDFDESAALVRKSLWKKAIIDHPISYARHRLSHFNSAIFFAVPALHARFNHAVRDGSGPGRQSLTTKDIKLDYIKKSFAVWPVTWLTLSFSSLVLIWPKLENSRTAVFSVALLASGLVYGLAYLVIGVASDIRYHLWTILATMLAAVIGWHQFLESWKQYTCQRNALITGIILVFLIGMISRIFDISYR
jgi:hypothetical protein